MTRINVLPPEELCNQHLLAEWRELPRMAWFAGKAASKDAPREYTLGAGHMKFFLDKGIFLENRHTDLTKELLRRGFQLSNTEPFIMSDRFGKKDYIPTADAVRINRARVLERMPASPRWELKGL
jgi:hypothetical protein